MNCKIFKRQLFSALFSITLFAVSMAAQTNEFTYQGKLSDAGMPSATYDFEFRLCNAEAVCAAPLQTKQRLGVAVTSGAFSVRLDFDAVHFNGDDRCLEIAVKRPDQMNFTTLNARQKITSAPYSVRSKSADEADNAAQLGGVNASEYVTTSTVGNSFIKNVATTQTGAKFNIDGNGIIGGVVGIGTTTPQAGLKLDVNGAAAIRPGGTGGSIQFGAPNSESGMSIGGNGAPRADVRFDGTTLKLVAVGAGLVPPNTNGVVIDTAGNVGIGTSAPQTGIKLDVTGNTVFRTANANINLGSPNSETGMTITGYGTNRADLRFDGSTLKLAATTAGIPSPTNGITINTAGSVGIGVAAPQTKLHIVGTTRSSVLEITGGSDLAEKFEFSETVKPGMVVAIDPRNAGKLTVARGAYNRQVAGIISGANNLAAGMILPDVKETANAMPVALSGRVWVYTDARKSPVAPGDLMTTADALPGYAMKVTNHKRAQGAIIGKAMTELKSGTGLVLVLVTLQ